MPTTEGDAMETATRPVRERALPDLDARFSGRILRKGDPGYDEARRLWSASIDHRPAVIVRPRTDRDVATAVLHARQADMEIAIRGGGHSTAGHSMSRGGITIDLSGMSNVTVDARTRRARVAGGAVLMDVAQAAAPARLAFPFGHVSHTGVGGLTLGGGVGWIMREHGLAIDSLRSARLVTAEGDVVTASESENPELYWGLRGGGGNFGVVTEFEFELHPFGPEVLAGLVLHPLDAAADVLRFSRDFMHDAPGALTVFETFLTVPPEAPFPAELRGRPAFGLGIAYAGSLDDAESAVRPLREFGRPALDLLGSMSYLGLQTMLDPTAPHGMRNYMKAHWLRDLPDAAIDEQVERHADVTAPMSLIINGRMGGAIERVPADATAFAHRDANRLLLAVSAWSEGEDEEHVEWCRGVFDAMSPYSTGGVYVNFLGDEGETRVKAGYDDTSWRRLVAVKDRWDPENVFHLNQNVEPS
jgi:FAD/FMN-containing dehydrogenase